MVSRFRKSLAKAAVPFAHTIAFLAGGSAAIEAVQPSEDVRITAVNVEVTSSAGNGVSLFGEKIASSFGFQEHIDVKLIDRDDYPRAIEETVEIFGVQPSTKRDKTNSTGQTTIDALEKKYHDDIAAALLHLGIKNVIVFSGGALAGSLLLQSSIWHYRHRNERDPGKISLLRRAGIPLAIAVAASSVTQIYNAQNILSDKQTLTRAEQVISAPIEEYLVTSTSNMAVNLATVTEQINLDVGRLTDIATTLKQGSKKVENQNGETHTYLIVSDSHNLPTAPQTIQEIMHASNAEALIVLGDFVDVGIQPEVDALSGITIGETTFIGWDEIRTCEAMDVDGSCRELGDQYPMYALIGNHDPSSLMEKLESLGFKDLTEISPEGLTDVLALDDACPADISATSDVTEQNIDAQECKEDYKKKNAAVGKDLIQEVSENENVQGMSAVGFFASDAAAKQFVGNIPIIFSGGTHKAGASQNNGTTLIEVASVGQGGARSAEYAGAVVATLSTDEKGQPSLVRCLDVRWDITSPGKESIQQCLR